MEKELRQSMHYYNRNIGDYHKKAGKLNMLQHGAYTLLLDACYDREKFPTKEEAYEWTWAEAVDEIKAVDYILKKFFKLIDGVYVQNNVNEKLAKYQEICQQNKEIALEREKNKRTKRAQVVHEAPPNQEPITNNQEPIRTNGDGDNVVDSTKAGRVCKKLHEMQVSQVNPSNPKFLALLNAGVEEIEFINMANTVPKDKLKFAYIIASVEGARLDASKMNKEGLKKRQRPWYISNTEIEKKCIEMGVKQDQAFPYRKTEVFKMMKITPEMVKKARAEFDGEK